jgi:hypothetical protein
MGRLIATTESLWTVGARATTRPCGTFTELLKKSLSQGAFLHLLESVIVNTQVYSD